MKNVTLVNIRASSISFSNTNPYLNGYQLNANMSITSDYIQKQSNNPFSVSLQIKPADESIKDGLTIEVSMTGECICNDENLSEGEYREEVYQIVLPHVRALVSSIMAICGWTPLFLPMLKSEK